MRSEQCGFVSCGAGAAAIAQCGSAVVCARHNTSAKNAVSARPPLRMVAQDGKVDQGQDIELGPRALRNLSFVRGQRSIFDASEGFSAVDAALFRKNDTARAYVNDVQIDFATGMPGASLYKSVRDNAEQIVAKTLDSLTKKHAGVMSMPTAFNCIRVDAEWFLRVTGYAIGGESERFLNMESLSLYPEIYDGFEVGVSFLVDLVRELDAATIAVVGPDAKEATKYFDAFVIALETFL